VIHVVAGVIRDVRGRVLLARRTQGRDLAGLWEFPGGKVEPGESPVIALARELHEELGIDARIGAQLIAVPQREPKALLLDVHIVDGFSGTPKGLDGQALAWVPPEQLSRYPTPPADVPVIAALLQPDRLLITPEPADADSVAWLASLERALAGGIRRVLLRAPVYAAEDTAGWGALVDDALAMCRRHGVDTWISADPKLARMHGAGLHLKSSQLADEAFTSVLGDLRLAASCHTPDELRAAQHLHCVHAFLGPVMPTQSHPDATSLGWEAFRARRAEAPSLPVYALGGMDPSHIGEARAHGAQGVAAIRGLWPE